MRLHGERGRAGDGLGGLKWKSLTTKCSRGERLHSCGAEFRAFSGSSGTLISTLGNCMCGFAESLTYEVHAINKSACLARFRAHLRAGLNCLSNQATYIVALRLRVTRIVVHLEQSQHEFASLFW